VVLAPEKIKFLKNNHLKEFKDLGFSFNIENDQIICSNHKIELISLPILINNYKSNSFKNKRIIVSEIEKIKADLKNHFRLKLSKKDWTCNFDNTLINETKVIDTYDHLKQIFYLKNSSSTCYMIPEPSDLEFIADFFFKNSNYSQEFHNVSSAFTAGWACWIQLDYVNFEWILFLEPIDELSEIKKLLIDNNFIFLSALRKDNFFRKYLNKKNIPIDLEVNFKSNFKEKNILLYTPYCHVLPNNPLFNKSTIEMCNKFLIMRKGITLILSDDANLKINLATELAAKYGKQVLLETIPKFNNEIICASFEWWINNSSLIKSPEQIIIPLLPIPSMSEPINQIMVSINKKCSKDWFRDFLLPEAIEKFEKSVSPLRRNSGKLIILDGRVNKRQWARSILQSIEPSEKINYMFPFD